MSAGEGVHHVFQVRFRDVAAAPAWPGRRSAGSELAFGRDWLTIEVSHAENGSAIRRIAISRRAIGASWRAIATSRCAIATAR